MFLFLKRFIQNLLKDDFLNYETRIQLLEINKAENEKRVKELTVDVLELQTVVKTLTQIIDTQLYVLDDITAKFASMTGDDCSCSSCSNSEEKFSDLFSSSKKIDKNKLN